LRHHDYQAAFTQYFHVFGYCLAGDIELLSYLVQAEGLYRYQSEYLASYWVCQSLENVSSHGLSP
jgi:hypothetical protein